MLRVLDAKATVARTVLVNHAFVDVQLRSDRVVADRVHDHVQALGVRGLRPRIEILLRVDEQPAIVWRVVERLEHRGRMRAERPVDEAFERSNPKPVVAAPGRCDAIAKPRPRVDRNSCVDACRQPSRFPPTLEDREIVPRPHVMHRRHATTRDESHRSIKRTIEVRVRQRRHRSRDDRLRVVLEHAGRLTARIAHDGSAGDLRRVASDAGRAQRRAIRQRHVAVESIHPHRVIGRVAIDPLAARKLPAPQLVIPIAVPDPRARWSSLGKVGDSSRELRRSGGVAQLNRRQAEPTFEEMNVRVDEARNDERAPRVDHPCGWLGSLHHLGARSDRRDHIAVREQRVGPWSAWIRRPDTRVDDRKRLVRCPAVGVMSHTGR